MNGVRIPDPPKQDAPQGQVNQYVVNMLQIMAANSRCSEHSARIRRVEIAIATFIAAVIGSGLLAAFNAYIFKVI